MHKIIHKKLFGLSAAMCLSLSLMTDPVAAQSGSQGNVSIASGTQVTVFGAHNFLTGGTGTQPGIIKTDRSGTPGIFGFGSAASYTGADDANHVDGYVSKVGNNFTFPVGDGTKLRSVQISSATPTTDVYRAAYFSDAPTPADAKVSSVEYWDLEGKGPVDVTLTWDAASNLTTLTNSRFIELVVMGYNTSTGTWESLGRDGGTTGTLEGPGSITAKGVDPNTYSAITFGVDKALPVTLIAFDARKEGSATSLSWATTAETNSDRFEIERSANGKVWSKIGIVASTGESKVLINYKFSDASPLNGENLYRLRMVDKDETFAYSSIRSVMFDLVAKPLAYPNPARDIVYIQDADYVSSVSVLDMNGKTVKDSGISAAGTIRVDGLSTGMYLVKVLHKDGGVKTQKIIIAK